MPSSIEILVLLILVIAGVGAGLLIFRRGRPQRPVCGKCGYEVAGLETLQCPECGSDLRRVGIMTPGMRRTMGPIGMAVVLAVVWTLLLPIIAAVANTLLIESGVVGGRYQTSRNVTFTAPRSGTFSMAEFTATGISSSPNTSPDRISLVIVGTDNSFAGELRMNTVDPIVEVRRGTQWQRISEEPDPQAIADWLSRILNTPASQLAAEADDIEKQLDRYISGNPSGSASAFTGVSTTTGTSWRPAQWFGFIKIFWFGLWLAGVIVIIHRGVRQRNAVNASDPANK